MVPMLFKNERSITLEIFRILFEIDNNFSKLWREDLLKKFCGAETLGKMLITHELTVSLGVKIHQKIWKRTNNKINIYLFKLKKKPVFDDIL